MNPKMTNLFRTRPPISFRFTMFLISLGLVFATVACTPKSTGESATQISTPQSISSASTSDSPLDQNAGMDVTSTIPCDQLIPKDEANSLMTGLSPTLSEEKSQGETTCTWQYTSKVNGQSAVFQLQAGYGGSAVETWTSARQAELDAQPSDLVVINIDGLGEENYTWTSKPDSIFVVYVRQGAQTLILQFHASDILFLGNESGIIDMTDRIFSRMNP
jgi:hypothetical protein